nr:hypothetical protein [Noviherbaspirillum malthae]
MNRVNTISSCQYRSHLSKAITCGIKYVYLHVGADAVDKLLISVNAVFNEDDFNALFASASR